MLTQRKATAVRPMARFEKLVVTETADEVLLYDTDKHHIHHLNATTAAVWRLCDGKHAIVDLAREAGAELGAKMDEATVRLALTKLDDAGLLKQHLVDELRMSRMSRRTFMQRAGVAGAIAVPAIVSTTSHAFAAWSQTTCTKPCMGDPDCVYVDGPNSGQTGDCQYCIGGFCADEVPSGGCGVECSGGPSPCSSPCSVCGGPGQPHGGVSCCNPATIDNNPATRCSTSNNRWNCAYIVGTEMQWDANGFPTEFNCGSAGLVSQPLAARQQDNSITSFAEPETGSLTVALVDGDTPIGGAVFELSNDTTVAASTATDDSGITSFAGLTPGDYTLRLISAPDGVSAGDVGVTIAAGDNSVTVTAATADAPTEEEQQPEQPTTGTAWITAVDNAAGPVKNFCVALDGTEFSGCDGGTGTATIANVPAGSYGVTLLSQDDGATQAENGAVNVPAGDVGTGTVYVTMPAPETEVPETEVPETEVPEIQMLETQVPETQVPETQVPETQVPETQVPETQVPETQVPETQVPETQVPDDTSSEDPAT